jgi:diguanylate cyclase (GGDEF)-like protein/PAS domain S-box-containing protein
LSASAASGDARIIRSGRALGAAYRQGEGVDDAKQLEQSLAALRTLYRAVRELNVARDLTATLQAVADTVVSSLGFGAAAVNLVHGDQLQIVAVAGPDVLCEQLNGQSGSRESWEQLLAKAEPWGALLYLPLADPVGDVPTWRPDNYPSVDPDAWQPDDVLMAPLHSPDGELVGVLSVDLPEGGRKPGRDQCELLEMFAAQAAIAIDNARLHWALRRSVSELEHEQQALRASEESFRLAFENAPSGMAMRGLRPPAEGRLLRANAALSNLLGYSERELRRDGLAAFTHPEDRDLLPEGETPRRIEVRFIRGDASLLWSSVHCSVVYDAAGNADFQLIHVEDVGERRSRELALVHQAAHDPLTGLANRTELRSRLYEILGHAEPVVVMFCDMDNFKQVNDTYGHAAGDAVLVEVGRRLRMHVREHDTVARVGGDEFVLLVRDLDPAAAGDLVTRLTNAVSRPVEYEGFRIRVSVSIGLGTSVPASTVDELLREADQAMYREKWERARRKTDMHPMRNTS